MIRVELERDSLEYEILRNATLAIGDVEGMTCELGVRRGGGSKVIIDALIESNNVNRHHVCVDPYGNIEYVRTDNSTGRLDYHNQMRNDCLFNIYAYVRNLPIDLHFFVLEDTEFFKRYSDGVPVYNQEKSILTKYALVHFDGPHSVELIKKEIEFFIDRTNQGSIFVFDDIRDYDHNLIEEMLFSNNWVLLEKGQHKASYRRV
jgi:hypothetical protein